MQLHDSSIDFKGTLQSAWEKLVDWQTMPEWDCFMERASFNGPLKLGSVGKLKMKNGPEVALVVTTFVPSHSYTDELSIMGSTLSFYHEVTEMLPGMITLRIRVEGRGIVVSLLAPFLRTDMARKMPSIMASFKEQLARKNPPQTS